MNQFVFETKQRNLFFGMMALGVLCMILTFVGDDALHTRFWSNFLHNSLFFTGIAFTAVLFYCAQIIAYSGWITVFKRLWEAASQFLIVGLVLMGVIVAGVWGHFHHLYHWADAPEVIKDEVLRHKAAFLNPVWYTVATFVFGGAWYFWAAKMRKISIEQDEYGTTEYKPYYKSKVWAAAFLPIGGFTSAAVIWQWVMSLDAHWYSTMFAWYTTISWLVTMIAFTILLIIYLKSKGYYQEITREHLHDLGKYMFAFSVFWTYLWFSQFMLIWYGNIGEETVYFQNRMDNYPVLYWGNLLMNFVLPFLILLRNDTKRKYGSLIFTASLIFFGHWWDFFQMVKPGALHTAHEAIAKMSPAVVGGTEEAAKHGAEFLMGFTIPGLLEVGTFVGFIGLFLYVMFHNLTKAGLVPKNDPFLAESLQHHV